MEDDEEPEPTLKSNKLTLPLILSVMGSSLGSLQHGYIYFMINNPVVVEMQVVNLLKEGTETDAVRLKFFFLLLILFAIGAVLGVYLWGCLADRYGRKFTILISNGISIFSSAALCLASVLKHFAFSLFTRFFVGIVSGTFTYSMSLYIIEISSLDLRGAFVTSLLIWVSWGYILDQILTNPQVWGNKEHYTLLVGITAIFAIVSSILLLPSPESPRFLYLQQNDEEKARQALKKLRGKENVEDEMEELRQEHLAESSQKNMTVWKLLCFPRLRWQLITVIVVVSGTRFVPTNAVFFFSKQSYKILGISAKTAGLLPLAGLLTIQLMILTVVFTVDSLGRRFLLLSGFLICSISYIALVFTYQINTPTMAFSSIVLVVVSLVGFVMGPASIFHLIIGEVFLQSSRASAYVVAGFFSWALLFLTNILFTLTQPYLETYFLLLCSPFLIFTFLYIFWVLPETSYKTFQEIQENMAEYTCRNSRKIMAE